jgi:hypothetical protein
VLDLLANNKVLDFMASALTHVEVAAIQKAPNMAKGTWLHGDGRQS